MMNRNGFSYRQKTTKAAQKPPEDAVEKAKSFWSFVELLELSICHLGALIRTLRYWERGRDSGAVRVSSDKNS